ncbi:hypothetical protein CR513_51423, partial [Mucuna pruriens]
TRNDVHEEKCHYKCSIPLVLGKNFGCSAINVTLLHNGINLTSDDMKIKTHFSGHLLFAFLFLATFSDCFPLVSAAPNDDSQGQIRFPSLFSLRSTCVLNFNTSQYVAFGECNDVKDDINKWGGDGFPSTLCCRNGLTVLSDALAWQALNSTTGQVFISQDEFERCGQSFHPQQGMSLSSCGFDNLYVGSSRCASFVLQNVRSMQPYQDALDKCSHFDQPFYQSCADCTAAIFSFRDALYDQVVKDTNNTERAICGVAAIVALATAKPSDHLVDKFLRCLPDPRTDKIFNKKWTNESKLHNCYLEYRRLKLYNCEAIYQKYKLCFYGTK